MTPIPVGIQVAMSSRPGPRAPWIAFLFRITSRFPVCGPHRLCAANERRKRAKSCDRTDDVPQPPLIAQLLPVRRRQLLCPVENTAGAFRAFPHPASVAQMREGKDRTTIRRLLGKELPFVYFYCHGERVSDADPNTWLAVGKTRETITAPDFIGWVEVWQRALKKLIWNEVRPLVFINACHALAIEPETLVSYLDAFIGRGGAAGVIGTEVKVNQILAMDVAEQFFSALLGGKETVETALRAIRMDYLRHGNMFGLVYTPYCWSELQIKMVEDRKNLTSPDLNHPIV